MTTTAATERIQLADDLATETPERIDTTLAAVEADLRRATERRDRAADNLRYALGYRARTRYVGRKSIREWPVNVEQAIVEASDPERVAALVGYEGRQVERYLADYETQNAAVKAARAEQQRLDGEWMRRPWSRFFLVTSSDGHIHSSMGCSTCHVTTSFGWLPNVSGKTEAEAVAEHGALLCTVCFPSAPVEWTNGREVEAAAKRATECPGSRTYDYADASPARRVSRYATCSTCEQRISLTSTGKMRAHKPAAA